MTPDDDAPLQLRPGSSLVEVREYLWWLHEEAADLHPIDRSTLAEQAKADLEQVEAVSAPSALVRNALSGRGLPGEADDDAADATEPEETPPEIVARAEDLLEGAGRRNLLDAAYRTMSRRGLVGEERNAKVLLLAGVGGCLAAPIHVVVHGESAAGKNNVARHAFELLPSRYVLAISGLSEHALEYRGGRIEGVLLVDEAEGQGQAEYGLRVAMSEGKLTRLTVNKGDDGRNQAEELEVEVAASVVTTTTAPALHAENQTRVFDLFVDEGEEVTREVLQRRAQEAAGTAAVASEEALDVWRGAVELLEPMDAVIPWAERLADGFPTGAVRARRDFPRVLALVEACALLHQRQRPTDEAGRIVATPEDWSIVRPLVQEVLGPSMTGINDTARKLAALHDELVKGQPGEWLRRPDLEKEANARDIASANTVHRWAKRLVELGIWEGRRESGKAWEHRRLRDVVEEPIPLPSPAELAEGFPTLPTPPNSGGGKGSCLRNKGNSAPPNPPRGKPEERPPGEGVSPDGDSETDWEAPETLGAERENPSYQGGLGGLGTPRRSTEGDDGSNTCTNCGAETVLGRVRCHDCAGPDDCASCGGDADGDFCDSCAAEVEDDAADRQGDLDAALEGDASMEEF